MPLTVTASDSVPRHTVQHFAGEAHEKAKKREKYLL
jgi:hypothetical protein